MSVWDSRLGAMGFLENLLNRYTPRTPGKPVFAVIDTETTGFNKRYDRIIEIAAVRADSHFNPVDSVLLQLGAGAKKAPFLLCDQRYVPVLSGRLEYPANNHCIRIRVTIGKHRALPLPQ